MARLCKTGRRRVRGRAIPNQRAQIDGTQAATDTIDYVATDQTGLTATSTRTVIVKQVGTHSSADAATGVATSCAADPASNSTSTLSDSRDFSL